MITNIAIFASGKGTNALNLIEQIKHFSKLNIAVLIVDQSDSPLLKLKLSIPVILIEKTINMKRSNHEKMILEKLKEFQVNWIFLAGYMRILSPKFLKTFYDHDLKKYRVLNIHPSLLPKFQGAHGFDMAFESNEPFSGITVHFVDDGVDTGEILLQMKFERKRSDTFLDFVERGKKVEMNLYPLALNWLEQLCQKN